MTGLIAGIKWALCFGKCGPLNRMGSEVAKIMPFGQHFVLKAPLLRPIFAEIQ
jgi:hypothetical protein